MSIAETLSLVKHGSRLVRDIRKMFPTGKTSPASLLMERVDRAPEDIAIWYEDESITWRELAERAGRYAEFFVKEGIAKDDVVALVMENRPDFVAITLGLNQIGAVSSLINTNLTGKALSHALSVCHARKILCGSECLDAVDAVVGEINSLAPDKDLLVALDTGAAAPAGHRIIDEEVAALTPIRGIYGHSPTNRDVYCYIYTSGTTGLPKAAIIRGQRMLASSVGFGHLMHRSGPGDVIYVTLPLYHSSAMFLGWGAVLATGAAMALRRKFSASRFWPDVSRYRATSFIYIGELCRYLLNSEVAPGERDHRVRVAVGNGMRPDIWVDFQERFGVPVIREFYGATEGNTVVMNLSGRPGMIGKMVAGQAVVRCDLATGEVIRNARGFCERVSPGQTGLLLGAISKAVSFDGYLDQEATSKKVLENVFKPGDRYFDTGDLIELHEGKWLSFADRAGDTFRWKGENVSTNEVAEILDGVPGVLEANVYGVEIPGTDGRAGMAALRVDEGFDLDAFAAHSEANLAKYQRPLFVRLLQGEMRVTATFKHQKVEYRKEAFDIDQIEDPIFVRLRGSYRPLDRETYEGIRSGELANELG